MKKFLIVGTVWGMVYYAMPSYAGAIENNYINFKNMLNDKYGIEYNLDYSLMGQHASPGGKYNAVQSYLAPSVTWTTFDNHYGTGVLNASYYSIFYGNHNANDIQNRTGMATSINDFTSNEQEFAALYYTYQLPHQYNWLILGAGQYSLYNFDGTDYDSNQQVNFINYSLSQNGSATYADAGLGAYIQATPENWNFTAGFQDATNIEAPSIRFNHLNDKHFATFAQIGYNPQIKRLGSGQYSIMLYNQPNVKEQPQTTNGWSFNAQQNIGEKLALFGRINGVSGSVVPIKNSYVAGMVYNNPFNRNSLDQIGLAYSYNDISAKAVGSELANSGEHVMEAYWAWGVSKWATLTPDLQFYINPALNEKSDYGTVFSLRLSVFF
ncbi:MAG: carbohydrate porin [Alphaproteobacteria bacterium]|nr:carbohydrate porin [Alphaproteobacteria bacterium]